MKSILFSPHDDDQALFAAFTCMREKPLVVVVTDSYIQPERGEVGCSAFERAEETRRACEILGVNVHRLAIPDKDFENEDQFVKALVRMPYRIEDVDVIYAPALQHGHPHHDLVHMALKRRFGPKVIEYTTYAKDKILGPGIGPKGEALEDQHIGYSISLHTTGNFEIVPSAEELIIKNRALACYVSQWRVNKLHFDAVMGKSEWLC